MKKIFTPLIILLFTFSIIHAQRTCGTTEHEAMLNATIPNYANERQKIEDFTQKFIEKSKLKSGSRSSEIITIPVVIHIVYKTDDENISDEQAISQIDVLNEDFRRLNADASETPSDFEDVAADFEIEFCLATVDPDGNITTGIERTETTVDSWSTDDAVKFTSEGGADAWPADQYLNLWCCNLEAGLLGYAQFPGGPSSTDGVVVTYSSFGREGFVIPPYDLGRTATHEVGHWLNLYHIWGDDGDCSGSDLCDDTPNQEVATYGCPTHPFADACNAAIMFQNYMDYTDDACYNMFTEDQKARARALFEDGGEREDLGNSTKCVYYEYDASAEAIVSPAGTYCYDTFSPVITIQNNGLTEMTSLTINYAYDGGASSTYFWTGALETGDQEDVNLPTITMVEGPHSLSVTVSDPNGNADENAANDAVTSDFVVNVTGYALPLVQGFEDASPFPYTGYTINNPDAELTWERTNLAAKTGGSSMYINTFNISDFDAYDEIQLPAYNMTGITAAHVDFDLANAAYSDDEDYSDTLEVLVSADCGITWTSVYKKFKPELGTTTPTGANFIPTNGQWRREEIDLTPYLADKLIVKFRSSSNWENNTYIDDINLNSGTVALNDATQFGFTLYPVPVSELINIQYYSNTQSDITAQFYNTIGELVFSEILSGRVGNNTTTISVHNLLPGFYSVKLSSEEFYSVQNFIKL